MTIDFDAWKQQQGLYDLLVLGLDSPAARREYYYELEKLGVRQNYLATATNIGLLWDISPESVANIIISTEEDFCVAIDDLEKNRLLNKNKKSRDCDKIKNKPRVKVNKKIIK